MFRATMGPSSGELTICMRHWYFSPCMGGCLVHWPDSHPYLLTYSMVQSPSWEANWFAASQEIPRISRNSNVHHRTHKCPPPVSILSQPNPVHIPASHLLEIRPNIIHPSTPRSPLWSLSLRFPHQDPIHPPLLTHIGWKIRVSHRYSKFSWWRAHSCPKHVQKLK